MLEQIIRFVEIQQLIIGYFNIDNDKDALNQFEDNSLIDCLTDLFIWLIRGNYLDNSKQKLN